MKCELGARLAPRPGVYKQIRRHSSLTFFVSCMQPKSLVEDLDYVLKCGYMPFIRDGTRQRSSASMCDLAISTGFNADKHQREVGVTAPGFSRTIVLSVC